MKPNISTRFSSGRRRMLQAVSAAALAPLMPAGAWANSQSKLAKSDKGMVTSPHELATRAGLDVLQSGGNAIEAAIAIASCLSVTYPHFSSFGGDAFMIISDASGNVETVSGIGQAPMQYPSFTGSIPVRGPGSMMTTAANVDTLGKAYKISKYRFGGSKSWGTLLEPAIGFARDGYAVSESQRFWTDFRMKELGAPSPFSEMYMPSGKVPSPGQVMRNPQLAQSLETLAERGPRDFYEGKLAERIVKSLKEVGSPITAFDLARTQARVESPLRVAYRGGELLSLRPPTQGITTLEIMGILERFDLSTIKEGSPDYYHVLVEAVKRAFIDRRHVADPDYVTVPVDKMLSRANLDTAAKTIRMDHALEWPHVFKNGDTVYIAATDSAGNCVSMLSTVYFDWGSGVMAGDTGILWHNRGASFSLDPASPNRLAGGKRPFHTLNPGMYLTEGRPTILYGTQGADGQPQTLAAVLTRLIDYKMDPLTALARPRFLLGKTFSDSRDSLKLEQDAGDEVFAALKLRGHEISAIPAQSQLAGHPGAIVIDRKTHKISGAHDPRSDGRALGMSS